MVERDDAGGAAGGAGGQLGAQQCVVGPVDEGHHGVPALVVEPDLGGGASGQSDAVGPAPPGSRPLPASTLRLLS